MDKDYSDDDGNDDDDDDDDGDGDDDDDENADIDDDDTFHHQSSLPVLIVLIRPSCWQTILADLSLMTMMIMAMMKTNGRNDSVLLEGILL